MILNLNLLVKRLLIFTLLVSLIRCNSNINNYKPSIIYNENNDSTEVRLTLPNGGSKIIYRIEKTILKSGEKCSYVSDMPMSGLAFLEDDTTYRLVNTSYANTGEEEYHTFYIYQKDKEIIVFRELIGVSGVGDYEVVFKGNITNSSEDELKVGNQLISSKESNSENKSMIFTPRDINSEFTKIVVEKLENNKVNFVQYFKNGDEISHSGKMKDGIINLGPGPEQEYYISINGNELKFENQWVGEVIFDLNGNNNESNYFEGEKLNKGEKIVKVNWGMENKTNFTNDFKTNGPRFSSNTMRVPNGKIWILIHLDENYRFESGLNLSIVPNLFVNNEKVEWDYGRKFSDKNNINISKAKIESLVFYPNESIRAVSDRQKGRRAGEDFYDYNGEMWFLELQNSDDLENERMKYEIKTLKEQNIDREKDIKALNRAVRGRRWREEAIRKMYRRN